MKTIKKILIAGFFAMLIAPGVSEAGPRIYVKIRPPKTKVLVVKLRMPYRNAVWVAGYHKWNGHRYVWVRGRWVKPRKGSVWVQGHWAHNRHGWYWVGGHWKRA